MSVQSFVVPDFVRLMSLGNILGSFNSRMLYDRHFKDAFIIRLMAETRNISQQREVEKMRAKLVINLNVFTVKISLPLDTNSLMIAVLIITVFTT